MRETDGFRKEPSVPLTDTNVTDQDDYDNSFTLLKSSVLQILTRRSEPDRLSNLSFEELYRNSYKIALNNKGWLLHRSFPGIFSIEIDKEW